MSAHVQVFPERHSKGPAKGQPTGQWCFRVRGGNHEKWVVSEAYTRKHDAKRGASRFLVSIAPIANHEVSRVADPGWYQSVIEVVDR